MSRFLKQTFLFLAILVLIDRSFLIFRVNETNMFVAIAKEKMEKISGLFLSRSTKDILIVGSSHAQFGVSPEVFMENTNYNCLNLAYGAGANMGLQLSLLKYIVKNARIFKPKLIVFGMDVITMNAAPRYTDQFQEILFQKSGIVNSEMESRIFNSYFKLYSRFIPMSMEEYRTHKWTSPFTASKPEYNLRMFETYDHYEISGRGWVKGFALPNRNYIRYDDAQFLPDPLAEKDLLEYIELCIQNRIQLVFFQIPEYIACLKSHKKYEDFEEYMKRVAEHYKIPYMDYNKTTAFPVEQDSLFFDTDHLNKRGAELFTQLFLKDLKKWNAEQLPPY